MQTHFKAEPEYQARTIAAELLQRVAVDADGALFDSTNPGTWEAEDAAEPELIRLGSVRLRVVDSDPAELALAVGAIDEGARPNTGLLVEFDEGEGVASPSMGQYIVLPAGGNVPLLFRVLLAHCDLHDPAAPDLGEGAVRHPALNVLKSGQALLVQVIEADAAP